MSRRTLPPTPQTPPGHIPRYRDRILDDERHDPYQPAGKYAEPTRCRVCGAVYHAGRWQWGGKSERSRQTTCPACRRVHDGLAAGSLVLQGSLVTEQPRELIRIVNAEAEHERNEHPLHRIMKIDERGDRIEISTTDIHLPQRIGEALRKAHGGNLAVHSAKDEYSVRVRWEG